MKKLICVLFVFYIVLSTMGCATYKTLEKTNPGGPKFFSGSRLDVNALSNNKVALQKFKVDPPKYPLLDLPGSFLLDLIISPATGIIALYETLEK